MFRRINFLEINIPLLDICLDQLDTYAVADIAASKPLYQFTFNRNAKKPYPGAFFGCACNNRIELLTNSPFKQ